MKMDIKSTLILYSKYSQISNNLLLLLNDLNNNDLNKFNIKKLCIDTEYIRNIIIKSNYDIKSVPSILIFYDKSYEKFEGNEAFVWVESLLKKRTNINFIEKEDSKSLDIIKDLEKKIQKLEQKLEQNIQENIQKNIQEKELQKPVNKKASEINNIRNLTSINNLPDINDIENNQPPPSALKAKQVELQNLATNMINEREIFTKQQENSKFNVFI